MLIELSVANFRSFRERVTLSLEAEPRISERDKAVDERNVAHAPDGDLLRVVGIYGANASGKSNLITALATLRTLVLNSAREGRWATNYRPPRFASTPRAWPPRARSRSYSSTADFRSATDRHSPRSKSNENGCSSDQPAQTRRSGGSSARETLLKPAASGSAIPRPRDEALHISAAAAWTNTRRPSRSSAGSRIRYRCSTASKAVLTRARPSSSSATAPTGKPSAPWSVAWILGSTIFKSKNTQARRC